MKLLYVHKKVAKGRTYYYFDLGRDEDGNHILKRLPDVRSHQFAAAYQAAKSQRSKQTGGETAKNFDWLIRIYEKSPEFRSKAENTKRLYARHLVYANENLPQQYRAKLAAGALSPPSMSWRCATSTPRSPGTANAILKSLGALYHWAKPGRRYVKEQSRRRGSRLEIGEHRSGR
jgi:hypothetical protein